MWGRKKTDPTMKKKKEKEATFGRRKKNGTFIIWQGT